MKIELNNTSNSSSAFHISISIDDKEVGILYLTEKELDLFLKTLKFGYLNMEGVEVENNCYIDNNDEEDSYDN